MNTRQLFLALLAAAVAPAAMAQAPAEAQQREVEKSQKVILFGDGPTDTVAINSLIGQYYVDQFRHAQDPLAPYFMLMSRNGQMGMGVGGQVEALGYYDWHGMVDGTDFAPYAIPMALDPAAINGYQTSMAHSALFFSVFGNDQRFGSYRLYIEAKFTGSGGHTFKLSKAYATVGDWTLGLAKSTFADPASQPSTVETAGPNSEVDDTRFLLRYMHSFTDRFTVALSAEQQSDQVATASNLYEGGSNYMPNVAAFLQYGTHKQHVRISGLLKNMRYRDLVDNKNGYVTGWGVNLTTVFRPVAPLTVYAAGNLGQGIGSMVNDLSCGVNDLVGLTDEPGKMYAPRSYGWYAALQYNYRPNLFSTVIFSQERILPRSTAAYGADDYKYGLYGTANVFWEVVPRCVLGAELNIGKRCNMDGAHRLAYRAGLMAQFNF